MSSALHPLDSATALEPAGEGQWRGRTEPRYGNMVGPFGGAIAAKLLKAPLLHPARLGHPVAFTVNFAGPLADGEFLVAARAARTNRSTQHWVIELTQAGETVATATAVFAVRRESWSSTEAVFPLVPPASSIPRSPPLERHAWTGCYDMRFVKGAPNFGSKVPADDSETIMWMRDEPPRPLDFVSLTAIADAFIPGRLFLRRPRWTPFATVSMTTYFHADEAMLAAHGSRELLGVARAQQIRNGYHDQSAELWTPEGALLAATYQTCYFKE
ncbi:acyl-CoA thioesterase [Quisquiliibacterium transsilvanicum]|uniref:Acyl-CoA thioesterase n=1 Tax=Quisquiliibacterium transsilvanicum TaxID=1549638 RepID=A0A7W8HKK1_9BURK|nr:thioesterase family protein [Quisquiliibacterium transsilvanicum]MBB5273755.1 acyl-CoA thioesterase [Quisquiliibacterium transsilvanicum]